MAFEWVDLVPGKAVDPKSVNLATQVYQTKMDYPDHDRPDGDEVRLHPDGEAAPLQGGDGAAETPIDRGQ